jgi:hypothetical protein
MNEAGSVSGGERPQEAPSTHETAPFRVMVEDLAWRERRAGTAPPVPFGISGGVLHVFYPYAART